MARKKDTLNIAHNNKNDEFYTQYEDIEREINNYFDYNKDVFKDKVILCPCDDDDRSNFTIYFAQNFEKLELKKLICTSYAYESKNSNFEYEPSDYEKKSEQFDENKTLVNGKVYILEKNKNNLGRVDFNDIKWKYLEGNGDFRSEEVIKFRNEADFIITNPPFSLFREFMRWIIEANKNFIILGNQNAITYKEVYPLIKENKIWLGCRFNERVNGKNLTYRVPSNYEMKASELYIADNGDKYITVPGTGWFTNVDHGKRHQKLSLMSYNDNLKFSKHMVIRENGYRKYDNYNAIDIPFVDAIPGDYKGYMGVPITFLGKFCPEQFEIITFRKGDDGKDLNINGKSLYFRIVIRSVE
ncbi:adenine-specific methyltransferase EcoRI family protein [Fusobacterium polymorphum]|uniref:adenine-specific methyltransferase EcoRI family protein n=1 Tax=Fusobacterium nucleatum subsp. polymorphum TaxID=76857 RepID=UPI00300BD615